MEKFLNFSKKIIPKKLFRACQPIYHYCLALCGAILNGFPARKICVIGVTGTKGKSSVTEIMNSILEEAGYKTALSNTIRFKIDDESDKNKFQMSMPGRFFMQNFLKNAVKKGCTHAVIEITSEGSKQYRHKFIYLDNFIFTNMEPEHIESHGSYEKYRECKLRISDNLANKDGAIFVNADDKESDLFLERCPTKNKYKFSMSDIAPVNYDNEINFRFKKTTFYSKLQGKFNVYNILAAVSVADKMGIDHQIIKKAIENLDEIPGRVQKVKLGQNFDVVVDYAHTPESLEGLYKSFGNKNKICVFGSDGGGRDKWKRPVLAKIADEYCKEIILTNENPHDEDPYTILNPMKESILNKPVEIITDRRQAIASAIKKAQKNDVILITGKGTEAYMIESLGRKTPWSDYKIAEEELEKHLAK